MSNKIIQMPVNKVKKNKNQNIPVSTRSFSPNTSQEIKDRGYSELNINIKITENRPVDMAKDVVITYDNKVLTGIGEIMVSGMPPHFRIGITNPQSLQESINNAGFFYNQGFFIYQVLLGANYPAVLCGKCNKGFLRINHGMRCDNGECENASNIAKSEYLKKQYVPQVDNSLVEENATNSEKEKETLV